MTPTANPLAKAQQSNNAGVTITATAKLYKLMPCPLCFDKDIVGQVFCPVCQGKCKIRDPREEPIVIKGKPCETTLSI